MSTQTQTQTQVRLKLVIDKKWKRILYAEADKTFVDFLFTILALPVGTVVKLLSTTAGQHFPNKLGSISNLYRSVESLNPTHFEANHNKNTLLKPDLPTFISAQSQIGALLPQIQPSPATKTSYFTCSECHYSFSSTHGVKCSRCGKFMTMNATYVYGADEARPVVGGYVKGGTATYIVMDDLSVKHMSCSSMFFASVLTELKVENVGQIDEKVIYLHVEDGVKLLRASLHSSTVLNDLFLHRINFSPSSVDAAAQYEPGRKRGRPRKIVDDAGVLIPRRKRGRPCKIVDEPKVAERSSEKKDRTLRDELRYWIPLKELQYNENNPNPERVPEAKEGEEDQTQKQ